MTWIASRAGSWLGRVFVLSAAAQLAGCGSYLSAELQGVLAENLSTAASNIAAPPGDRGCAPGPNRCGPSGLLALLIPDCPFGVACFSTACNDHDICYQECGVSKTECDNRFFEEMMSICSGRLVGEEQELAHCFALAFVYWQAVLRYGQEAFDATQRQACECGDRANLTGSLHRPFLNGIDDVCDIRDGTSLDVDGNGEPDECHCSPPPPLLRTAVDNVHVRGSWSCSCFKA